MIILKTLSTTQTLTVIPREYTATFSMSVRDDSTNVTTIYEITTATTSGNYLVFNNTFNPVLVEGHFYDIRLYVDYNFWNTNFNLWESETTKWNETNTFVSEIFSDRIFCTDQTIDQANNEYYELNEGQYVYNNSYDNDYIVR